MIEASGGVVTIVNSTFYGNSTPKQGGVLDAATAVTVTNSTFSHNSADGNLYWLVNQAAAPAPLDEVTHGNVMRITGAPTGTVTLINTILADNGEGDGCIGAATDGGGNLYWQAGDATCPGAAADPRLLPLADNGGPTLTQLPGAGSAALQLTATHCPATDQRGFRRPLAGGKCDAGAVEVVVVGAWLPIIEKE